MPDSAMEVKGLHQIEGRAQQRLDSLDMFQRTMPDSMRKRVIAGNVDRLSQKLVGGLAGIMARVRGGSLEPDDANDEARRIMAPIYAAAARQGFTLAGVPKWLMTNAQVDDLALLVEDEIEFFGRFMRETAREAMSPDDRIRLYGGGADSAFWRGWLALLPSNAVVEWHLRPAEHCGDCLRLAANSPYTKRTLPTVPRNGGTRCLSNCFCFLESTGTFASGLVNKVAVEITHIGALEIDPMAPGAIAAAGLYQDLAERYVYYRRMNVLEPGKGHDQLASGALREMERIAQQAGHSFRMSVSMAEVLDPVTTALAAGYRFVPPQEVGGDDFDFLLAMAIVVSMNWSDRGKITRIDVNPPTIMLDNDPERSYRLDAVGRAILFLESP